MSNRHTSNVNMLIVLTAIVPGVCNSGVPNAPSAKEAVPIVCKQNQRNEQIKSRLDCAVRAARCVQSAKCCAK